MKGQPPIRGYPNTQQTRPVSRLPPVHPQRLGGTQQQQRLQQQHQTPQRLQSQPRLISPAPVQQRRPVQPVQPRPVVHAPIPKHETIRSMADEDRDDDEEDTIKIVLIPSATPKSNSGGIRYEDYKKVGQSLQDLISENAALFTKKLENFEVIEPKHYHDIDIGTFIRYVTYDKEGRSKLRLGGILINNKAPKYWILRAGGKRRITWSVNLQHNKEIAAKPTKCYMKTGTRRKSEKVGDGPAAEELLEAVLSGKYQLVPKTIITAMEGGGGINANNIISSHSRCNLIGDDNDDYEGSDD